GETENTRLRIQRKRGKWKSVTQQYIHHLEAQLQEEMSRHAPLCGAGLEALSMKELETISRIHEEGLRQIHAIQQRKGSPAGSPLVSSHNLPPTHGLYPPTPPPMDVGLPPPLIPNGVGIHRNGHVNGGAGPWTSLIKKLTACSQSDGIGKRSSFTWKVENFLSFKEIMETRKIFSKFFQAGGCELRIARFSPERIWYIDQMVKVLTQAGNYVKDEVWHALIIVITNAPNLHGYTVKALNKAVQTAGGQDPDASIRKRALKLVYLLVNESNVKPLTKELVDYLEVSEPEFKGDLTVKICSIVEKSDICFVLKQLFKDI
ncbi:UNVERIFIED_CONTAM: AP-1 complex subunit gamma-2, partial [Sesamum indicum]